MVLLILNKFIVGAFDSKFFNVQALGDLAALGSLDKSKVTVPVREVFKKILVSCAFLALLIRWRAEITAALYSMKLTQKVIFGKRIIVPDLQSKSTWNFKFCFVQ